MKGSLFATSLFAAATVMGAAAAAPVHAAEPQLSADDGRIGSEFLP